MNGNFLRATVDGDQFVLAAINRASEMTMKDIMKWYRWLFRLCQDCGVKLPKHYNRGDVCKKCFDRWNL